MKSCCCRLIATVKIYSHGIDQGNQRTRHGKPEASSELLMMKMTMLMLSACYLEGASEAQELRQAWIQFDWINQSSFDADNVQVMEIRGKEGEEKGDEKRGEKGDQQGDNSRNARRARKERV
eukprot:766679-Hanusia_phi.AAC.6